jgi:endonuclease III-like uncharacterized protein
MEELEKLEPNEARKMLLELPGIGDYSADIINPHGGFPIDAWSVEVFRKLFYGQEPIDKRKAIEGIKMRGFEGGEDGPGWPSFMWCRIWRTCQGS